MSEIERLIAAANKAREFSFALGPRAQIVLPMSWKSRRLGGLLVTLEPFSFSGGCLNNA
jgi:hypothetical protein